MVIEGREEDFHFCKNNMGSGRNVEQGEQNRVAEEEKSMNTEVCQQNASYCRSTTRQVDVSNTL